MLRHGREVPWWWFLFLISNLVPNLCLSPISLTPSFCRTHQLVFITISFWVSPKGITWSWNMLAEPKADKCDTIENKWEANKQTEQKQNMYRYSITHYEIMTFLGWLWCTHHMTRIRQTHNVWKTLWDWLRWACHTLCVRDWRNRLGLRDQTLSRPVRSALDLVGTICGIDAKRFLEFWVCVSRLFSGFTPQIL